MDPAIVIAVVAGAGTTLLAAAIAFISLVWKIGRWQAKAEERNKNLCQRLNAFIDRADSDIAKAHDRIDQHLEGH